MRAVSPEPGTSVKRPADLNRKGSSRRSWRLAVILATLLIPVVIGVVLVLTVPPSRIGDGTEYLLSTIAFGDTHRPFITQALIDRYNELIRREPLLDSYPVQPRQDTFYPPPLPGPAGPTYEPRHFWFLGLLTAPYYWLTQAAGLNFANSYTLLFVALWLAMTVTGYRLHGASGAMAATLLMVFSPALWYVNKAHTEFLTISAVLTALVLVDRNLLMAASLVLSVAATQNPALSPLVVLLLALGLWSKRGAFTPADVALFTAAVMLICLAPGYYFARHGILNPLVAEGYSSVRIISPKRIVSLFLDPDIGLYPNWPFGLLLVLAGAAAMIRRDALASIARKMRQKPSLFVLAGAFLVLEPLAQASHVNLNSGGTVHLSHHATWYIPLHYPLLRYLLRRAAVLWSAIPPLQRWGGAAALACLAAPAIYFNSFWFAPQRPEVFQQDSPAASLLYSHLPAVFDPVPDVFIYRTGIPTRAYPSDDRRLDLRRLGAAGAALFDQGIWGFGVPSCRKIYVIAGMLAPGRADPAQRPYGCVALVDARKLFAQAQAHGGDRDFYLNVSLADLRGSYAALAVGRRVVFSDPEAGRYLGEGWSVAEAGFRWTDGRTARLAFQVSPEDLARSAGRLLALRVDALGMTARVPVQVVRIAVNGGPAGVYSWPAGQRPMTDIPVAPGSAGNVMVEFRIQYPQIDGTRGPDARELGLMCFSMELIPL